MAGSNLTFTIAISVDSYVDTPHTVSVSWARNGNILTNGGRITVSDVFNTNYLNLYQAQLIFSSLSSTTDSGMYTTSASVNSVSSNPYVTTALPTTETINITVNGKKSTNALVILHVYYLTQLVHMLGIFLKIKNQL